MKRSSQPDSTFRCDPRRLMPGDTITVSIDRRKTQQPVPGGRCGLIGTKLAVTLLEEIEPPQRLFRAKVTRGFAVMPAHYVPDAVSERKAA